MCSEASLGSGMYHLWCTTIKAVAMLYNILLYTQAFLKPVLLWGLSSSYVVAKTIQQEIYEISKQLGKTLTLILKNVKITWQMIIT